MKINIPMRACNLCPPEAGCDVAVTNSYREENRRNYCLGVKSMGQLD
jgi:hypothetical protein